jgi:glutamine amidotransferase
MIHILDYGIGNIKSLSNALSFIEADFKIITSLKDESIDKLIIPGVGAYQMAMNLLAEKNMIEGIQELNAKKKIIFGICLGMQILSTEGKEGGSSKGLNLIEGVVIPFPDSSNQIPNVGFNELTITMKDSLLLKNLPDKAPVYFTHSYFFQTTYPKNVSSSSTNGIVFTATVEKDNVFGAQFHPEISQEAGLLILKNFNNL